MLPGADPGPVALKRAGRAMHRAAAVAACALLLISCQIAPPPATPPTPSPEGSHPQDILSVDVLYPQPDTSVAMGGTMSVIAQVFDSKSEAVIGAEAEIHVWDSDGKLMAVVPMKPGADGVYRATSWLVPHRTAAGEWRVRVDVQQGAAAAGRAEGRFTVAPSLSEVLLQKYGFWIDAPTLGGINPTLVAERGDAQNGLVRWGGTLPGAHVFPEAWLEVQWRSKLADLSGPQAVRRFLLDDLGDFGFRPIRDIGAITPFEFQGRPAWKVRLRGEYAYEDIEYVVFAADRVGKTFAIGATLVLPPTGVEAQASLRDSFELPEGILAEGEAPEPLPDILPGPGLVSPPLGARYQGGQALIVLEWSPVKVLGPGEAYQVELSTNYDESSPRMSFTTRSTQLLVPGSLYHEPNCRVFNWQVRLVHLPDSSPSGPSDLEPESYASLFRYFIWSRPPGETSEFLPLCPNVQY